MGNLAFCKLCPWLQMWSTETAAEAAAVWHVYREHHDTWTELTGSPDRLPVDKMPEDYGTLLPALI